MRIVIILFGLGFLFSCSPTKESKPAVSETLDFRFVGHSGSQSGFLSNYITIPEKGIFFAILCNAPREEYEMEKSTLHMLNILKEYNWMKNE